jgi:flagellin-like hook-associated protein FlgL
MLSTADAAAGEIVTQLQSARTLALDAASGTLSDADIAANQVQIDTSLVHPEFAY